MNSPASYASSSMLLHSRNHVWQGAGAVGPPSPCRLDHLPTVRVPNLQQQRAKVAVSLSWKTGWRSFSSWGRQAMGIHEESRPGGLWRVGRFPLPATISRLNADLFCGSDVRIIATGAHDNGKNSAVSIEMVERKKKTTTKRIRDLEDTPVVLDGVVVEEDGGEAKAAKMGTVGGGDRAVFVVSEELDAHRWRSDREAASSSSSTREMAQQQVLELDGGETGRGPRAAETRNGFYSHVSPQYATSSSKEGEGDAALEYYIPKVGDQVMGVVVSGNHSKLDIAIGAERLGHMFVSEMFPLDKRDLAENMWEMPEGDSLATSGVAPPLGQALTVKDEEVLSMGGVDTHLPVEVGTILTMDVKGQMASGAALLSARSVARRNAWNRVQQIKDRNEPIEIEITDCNAAGLISRIEGLRAFLPLYNLVKQPTGFLPECLKDYVGRRMWVQISTIHGKNSNLVVNEKQAWVSRNLHLGTLVDGTVAEVYTFGARVKIKDTDISTADLESEDGLMLTDRERVCREAEVMAKAYRDAHPAQEENFLQQVECLSDSDEPEQPIANWDWLEFGANPETVY
ncbi:hypothetical protein CY35_10G028200 [Sphagnum magellanicum]|nr:hypothetical protein CY35_10G028200 [Sphagnum magellanicum]